MRKRRVRSYANGPLRFDVVDAGPLDGEVVLLLHGFPERASHWAAVSAHLAHAGLRTLAPDQRGYSPGARPRGRASYRMSALVDDVVALQREVGTPVHLVGHDWGAAVAWRTAATHPALFRTLTTISVPHPAAFARSVATSSQLWRSWYVAAFQPPLLAEAAARLAPLVYTSALRASGMDEDGVRRFRAEIIDSGALPGALGWYRALPLDALTTTAPVSVPTTHVWCDQEVALSRRGARLTEQYVEAPYELVTLRGVSHWAPTQAPDLVAEAILRRVNGAATASRSEAAGRSAPKRRSGQVVRGDRPR